MNQFSGIKELYDVDIRLTQPLDICGRHFDINESIINFSKAEIGQISQHMETTEIKGGYKGNFLLDWNEDKQVQFALSNGILSPLSLSILSNSQLLKRNTCSVPYQEECKVIEDDNNSWYCLTKYIPNHIDGTFGLQGNPNNDPMPMGRKRDIPLKPLPPSPDKYLFCYDIDTGKKILKFEVLGNKIIFKGEHKNVKIDYTFDYNEDILDLTVGKRLIESSVRLTAKTTFKDQTTGETKTAIINIPNMRLRSELNLRLGEFVDNPVMSNLYFVAYPKTGGGGIFEIRLLSRELTGDYL